MTDGQETPLPIHEPPSLPSSPQAKRTRQVDELSTAPLDPIATTPTPHDTMASNAPLTAPLPPPSALAAGFAAAPTPAPSLEVQLLSDKATPPTKGSAFAAGHDLYSARDLVIPARERARVDTDLAISVPVGTYGRVAPRSGLAYKHGIDTLAGVIDADYRGQVGVILANLSDTAFEVKVGDRIAQLIVEKIVMPDVVVVKQLSETVRGAGGFGSTGGFGVSNGGA